MQNLYNRNRTNRDIILKARKQGFSAYILADFLLDCLTLSNLNAVVISHEKTATKRLLERVFFYIRSMEQKPRMRQESAEMIRFEYTNSTFYVGTAGSKAFGRGDDIHRLHCSEISSWEKPDELMLGVKEAMAGKDSRTIIETTARGFGNYFQREYTRAKNGESGYKAHFYRWFDSPEYQIQPTTPLILDKDELELRAKYKLTDAQLFWRREKIRDTGVRGFLQEYPSDDQSCFLQSGRPVFIAEHCKVKSEFIDLNSVPANAEYVIGADVAEGGENGDYDMASVLDRETGKEVYSIRGQWTPDVFAQKLAKLGETFNEALIGPERNNHGHAVISKLNSLGYRNIFVFRDRKYGWLTSEATRYFMIDDLEEAVRREWIKIATSHTIDEMLTLQYNDKGKAEAPQGLHDDCVMATAIAWQIRKTFIRNEE